MEKFRFFEHTADVLFEAYGKTLSELFANAALALQEVQVKVDTVDQKEKRTIKLENKKLDRLLFDFLQELIFLKDAEELVFSRFEVDVGQAEPYRLTAVCHGEKIAQGKHELGVDAKAITLHRFEVKKEKARWVARVIVDI